MLSLLCEAYEVGFDFVSPRNNHNNQPHPNLAALTQSLSTGEGPSCESLFWTIYKGFILIVCYMEWYTTAPPYKKLLKK